LLVVFSAFQEIVFFLFFGFRFPSLYCGIGYWLS
jgi:hypothetical protein